MRVRTLSALCVFIFLITACEQSEVEKAEARYTNDPVMLYKTVGIKGCGANYRFKAERAGAVRLRGDDLEKALEFLYAKHVDVSDVLYINSPESDEHRSGQPALLPLKRSGDTYCAIGSAGSNSVELFLKFKKKYQSQIE